MLYSQYARCGHCKTLVPIWESIATDLKGQIKVAKVDATTNVPLSKRFEVKGYPTLFLFHNGKSYKFKGKRTAENLVAFAKGGFKDEGGEPVPKEPGILEEIKDRVESTWKRVAFDMKNGNYLTLNLFLLVLPILFILLLALCIVCDSPDHSHLKSYSAPPSKDDTSKKSSTEIQDKVGLKEE